MRADGHVLVVSLHPGRDDYKSYLPRLLAIVDRLQKADAVRVVITPRINPQPEQPHHASLVIDADNRLGCDNIKSAAKSYAQAVPGALINTAPIERKISAVAEGAGVHPYLNGARNDEVIRLFHPRGGVIPMPAETMPEGHVAANLVDMIL